MAEPPKSSIWPNRTFGSSATTAACRSAKKGARKAGPFGATRFDWRVDFRTMDQKIILKTEDLL